MKKLLAAMLILASVSANAALVTYEKIATNVDGAEFAIAPYGKAVNGVYAVPVKMTISKVGKVSKQIIYINCGEGTFSTTGLNGFEDIDVMTPAFDIYEKVCK